MNEIEMRELDSWIDQNIFGNPPHCLHWNIEQLGGSLMVCKDCSKQFGETSLALSLAQIPFYSTNSASSMEVLKRCSQKLYDEGNEQSVCIEVIMDGWRVVVSDVACPKQAEANALELAICKFSKILFSK